MDAGRCTGLEATPLVVIADGGRGGGGVFDIRGVGTVCGGCICGGMADGGATDGGRGVWYIAALGWAARIDAGVG